ncbi:MAG: hypothetical protein JRI23_20840, partial [Deltaproteobacteria bacterium]|nr:hypothetical protein [Deltaproteobacteria bacterium]MBW2534369.1 hypothetical protein [Deltaproteobacteria bacterium]
MSASDPNQPRPRSAADAGGAAEFRARLEQLSPNAEGTLGRTPLLHQLVFALDRKLVGTTALWLPDGRVHGIFLHEGVPSKARTSDTVAPLDRVLAQMGVVDETTLTSTLREVSARRVLHGQILLERGLIDQATLIRALTRQVLQKVTFMIGLGPDTRFTFYEQANALDDYGGPELCPPEPLSVIMASVRTRPRDAVVDQTLQKLGQLPLRIRDGADTSLFGFTADEQEVVSHLAARPSSLADLLTAEVAQRRVVQLTVYALVITRCLDLGGAAKPPVGHDPSRPRPATPVQSAVEATPKPRGSRPSAFGGARPGPAAPLPRRGFATNQAANVSLRPRSEARKAVDTRPRRSSPTGR